MRDTKCIVYTRWDGGVDICHPSQEVLDLMAKGGAWNDRPQGFFMEQVRRMVAEGISLGHALRFATAVQYGGIGNLEAWTILCDRDCARFGKHHEIQDIADLPDRWFRNAWKRSDNGGPVTIDLEKARDIQLRHIAVAVERGNRFLNRLTLFGLRPKVEPDWEALGKQLRGARDADDLRAIWPEGVALPQSKSKGPSYVGHKFQMADITAAPITNPPKNVSMGSSL